MQATMGPYFTLQVFMWLLLLALAQHQKAAGPTHCKVNGKEISYF